MVRHLWGYLDTSNVGSILVVTAPLALLTHWWHKRHHNLLKHHLGHDKEHTSG